MTADTIAICLLIGVLIYITFYSNGDSGDNGWHGNGNDWPDAHA